MNITEILVCPHTQNPLRWLTDEEISALNLHIGLYRFYTGEVINFSIVKALTDIHQKFIYLYKEGIYFLMKNLAICKTSRLNISYADENYNTEAYKQAKIFYENFGWQLNNDDEYNDGAIFNDNRKFAKEYVSKCHKRVNKFLDYTGEYMVDIASGPIQHEEYIKYSENFKKRICIDISVEALKGAKRKIGDHGVYILGDITNIPLKSGSADAAISLHTIYHIDKQKQHLAFRELYRILKKGAKCVIIYSWGGKNSLNTTEQHFSHLISPFVKGLKRFISKNKAIMNTQAAPMPLYFYAYSPIEIKQMLQRENIKAEFYLWCLLDMWIIKKYLVAESAGKPFLKFASFLEDKFAKQLYKFGAYPLILLIK